MNQNFAQTTTPLTGVVVQSESRVNKIVPLLFAFLFGAVLIGFIGLFIYQRLEAKRYDQERYRTQQDYIAQLKFQTDLHNLLLQNLSNQALSDDASFKKLPPQQRKKKLLSDAISFTDSVNVIFDRRWSVTADSVKTYQLSTPKGEKP